MKAVDPRFEVRACKLHGRFEPGRRCPMHGVGGQGWKPFEGGKRSVSLSRCGPLAEDSPDVEDEGVTGRRREGAIESLQKCQAAADIHLGGL